MEIDCTNNKRLVVPVHVATVFVVSIALLFYQAMSTIVDITNSIT